MSASATVRLWRKCRAANDELRLEGSGESKRRGRCGELFEQGMMNLEVNIPLEEALDRGWSILAQCFEPQETGLRTELMKEYWPNKEQLG